MRSLVLRANIFLWGAVLMLLLCGCAGGLDEGQKSREQEGRAQANTAKAAPVFTDINTPIYDGLNIIIFASLNCGGCEAMRHYIATSDSAKKELDGLKIYYANISDDINLNILIDGEKKRLNTASLKERFNIYGTPTLVALKDGKILLIYAGFMKEARFLATIRALKDPGVSQLDAPSIEQKLNEIYQKESV